MLRQLGLPTSKMIREGDYVDATLLTSNEPHLAVFGLSKYLFGSLFEFFSTQH